jgi:hypothetical protein
MIADFTATPVASDKFGEELGATWGMAAYVIGDGLLLLGQRFLDTGLLHDDEASYMRQVDSNGLESEDTYLALIDTSMAGIEGLYGKKGEESAAI